MARCLEFCRAPRTSHTVITANASHLCMMRRDPELALACRAGHLTVADGMSVVWALRASGQPVPERVAGVDLMARLLAAAGEHRLRVYFLGARREVVTALVKRSRVQHPGLEIAGFRDGYFGPDDHLGIVEEIRASGAHMLFVGMPSPFKETWCERHRQRLEVPVIMGVGGSFDVLAGFIKRAPRWVQSLGLEWFWRLLMEPRKLWKRYLTTNSEFIWLAGREIVARRLGRLPATQCQTRTGERALTTTRNIAVFMGTRPEAVKLAPVVAALRGANDFRCTVVATGQHKEMFRQVAETFGFAVDADLDVMRPNQTLAGLTARLMDGIDGWLGSAQPDMALVQGDTTTVLVASLACFYRRIPIGHVEAGLRTGNIWSPFPEEVNRRLATPLVALHFAPTEAARAALLREAVPEETISVTGNTVIDALRIEVATQAGDAALRARIDEELSLLVGADWAQVPMVLITGHRRENFGEGIEQICQAIATLAEGFPDHRFVYPVHLNPNVLVHVNRLLGSLSNVRLIAPQGYRNFVALMVRCRLVLTDSGGVQEEAPSLGKPVLVMRDTTERPEGVAAGTAFLTGPNAPAIVEHATRLLTDETAYRSMATAKNPYGDGHAAERIVERIRRYFATRAPGTLGSPGLGEPERMELGKLGR